MSTPRTSAPVVLTGVGGVSALGAGGREEVREALGRGRPGLGRVRAFSTEGCRSRLGGEVGDLSPYLDPEEQRRLPRVSQLAVVAARLALRDAGLEPHGLPGLGLVLGSAYGDFRSSEGFARGYLDRGPAGLSALLFPSTVMNAMAGHAAIAVGARGPMLTLNQPGIAGELAVVRGAALVAAGRAPAVLALGVDELCPILYQELSRLGVTSPRDGGPEGCWPFDRRANGPVVGEGATALLLEREDLARARRARILAGLRGWAWGNRPGPGLRGAPRDRGSSVIERVLAMAGVSPAAVGAAYLTGLGAPADDRVELALVAATFERGPWLTALTPLAGDHAGLGVLRVAAAAVATLGAGFVPGLPELAEPVRPGLAYAIGPGAVACRTDAVLVHGLAPGGGHVALVLGGADGERP